jgi:hypothetical protein
MLAVKRDTRQDKSANFKRICVKLHVDFKNKKKELEEFHYYLKGVNWTTETKRNPEETARKMVFVPSISLKIDFLRTNWRIFISFCCHALLVTRFPSTFRCAEVKT